MSSAKNPKIKASVRKEFGTHSELTEEQVREKRMASKIKAASEFSKPFDIIAQDHFFVRNTKIPKACELFPAESFRMHFADMTYPYAKLPDGSRGALYCDVATNAYEISICERKLKAFREAGIPYTYLKPGEGAWEGELRLDGQDPDEVKADQRERFVSQHRDDENKGATR